MSQRLTRIRIDPNVRVHGDKTYASFDDVTFGELTHVSQTVVVVEPEANLIGRGSVAWFDPFKRLVYLDVNWQSLKETTT